MNGPIYPVSRAFGPIEPAALLIAHNKETRLNTCPMSRHSKIKQLIGLCCRLLLFPLFLCRSLRSITFSTRDNAHMHPMRKKPKMRNSVRALIGFAAVWHSFAWSAFVWCAYWILNQFHIFNRITDRKNVLFFFKLHRTRLGCAMQCQSHSKWGLELYLYRYRSYLGLRFCWTQQHLIA